LDAIDAVDMLAGYRLLSRVFDVIVGPLMRVGSFAREKLPPTPGNAFKTVGLTDPSSRRAT